MIINLSELEQLDIIAMRNLQQRVYFRFKLLNGMSSLILEGPGQNLGSVIRLVALLTAHD
jgi:hypothetical protein